jgi:uncharacterized integral membrane protein
MLLRLPPVTCLHWAVFATSVVVANLAWPFAWPLAVAAVLAYLASLALAVVRLEPGSGA